jgi:hypothetical protein
VVYFPLRLAEARVMTDDLTVCGDIAIQAATFWASISEAKSIARAEKTNSKTRVVLE